MDAELAIKILNDFEEKLKNHGIESIGKYHINIEDEETREQILSKLGKYDGEVLEVNYSSLNYIPYAVKQLIPGISHAYVLLHEGHPSIRIDFNEQSTYIQGDSEYNQDFENSVKKASFDIGFKLKSEN